MKYLIAILEGKPLVLLFSDHLTANEVLPFAKNLAHQSAGFCEIFPNRVVTKADPSSHIPVEEVAGALDKLAGKDK